MASPEISIGLRGSANAAEQARRIEALGFGSVHCGEHLFFHGPTPNAMVALGVAAGATTTLRLLSAVTLLPLYPAAVVAKMASVLDLASGGRFRLGVGVGGEYPPEFEAAGVPRSERGARCDEALEAISSLFTGEPVAFEGRWTRIAGLRLDPPPITPGGPELWVAGRSEAAQRRAGRFGRVWMPYMCTPEQLEAGLATARDAAVGVGRERAAVEGCAYAFVTVDRDGDRARRIAERVVGEIYQQDFSKRGRYLVAGTPEQCAARLHEYHAAGATALALNVACEDRDADRMLELLATEVLPKMER